MLLPLPRAHRVEPNPQYPEPLNPLPITNALSQNVELLQWCISPRLKQTELNKHILTAEREYGVPDLHCQLRPQVCIAPLASRRVHDRLHSTMPNKKFILFHRLNPLLELLYLHAEGPMVKQNIIMPSVDLKPGWIAKGHA